MCQSQPLPPEKLDFTGQLVTEWVHSWRAMVQIDPLDKLAMAIALERAAGELRREASQG